MKVILFFRGSNRSRRHNTRWASLFFVEARSFSDGILISRINMRNKRTKHNVCDTMNAKFFVHAKKTQELIPPGPAMWYICGTLVEHYEAFQRQFHTCSVTETERGTSCPSRQLREIWFVKLNDPRRVSLLVKIFTLIIFTHVNERAQRPIIAERRYCHRPDGGLTFQLQRHFFVPRKKQSRRTRACGWTVQKWAMTYSNKNVFSFEKKN